jgi:hypothetical protein
MSRCGIWIAPSGSGRAREPRKATDEPDARPVVRSIAMAAITVAADVGLRAGRAGHPVYRH